jgi:N-acyl-D-amino-acid deacylase
VAERLTLFAGDDRWMNDKLANRDANAQGTTPTARGATSMTGETRPELAAFDALLADRMQTGSIPGGQLAIGRGDRLVYNRGFGYASIEDDEIVEPDARFRIASTTKPITAAAILRLVDAGKLSLDTPVFPLLDMEPLGNAPYDPRLDLITVEHLLTHSGGWNSAAGFDPQYTPWPQFIAQLIGAESPPSPQTIIRYMLSVPLDFDPGTQSAYSNFGFNVLGRVIEKVSGQPFEQHIVQMLATADITSMTVGGTLLDERLPGEVRYYGQPDAAFVPSLYPVGGFITEGYGGFYVPALDAHGGLISTAADLVRFALAVDGARGPRLLTPETVTVMETTARPPSAYAGAGNKEGGFGLGWNVRKTDDGYEWSHAGALTGSTASWLMRQADGTTISVVFNSLPTDYGAFFGDLFPALQQTAADVSAWPTIVLWE